MSGGCGGRAEPGGLSGNTASIVHRLDPRTKLLGLALVTVVEVTAPRGSWPVHGAGLLTLAAITWAGRIPVLELVRRARIVLVLVVPAAAVLPFARHGGDTFGLGPLTVHEEGLRMMASVLTTSAIGVGSGALLTMTTTFPDVVRALEALRVPRLIVVIAGLMYRYLFVVTAEAERMRTALSARGWRPRSLAQAATLGRLATALFLRSYARGERVHLAMLARGYDGRIVRLTPLTLGRSDALFVLVVVAALAPVRVLGGAA